MADNVAIKNASEATVNIAADEIGGVQYPRTKTCWGAEGAANDTSAANPLPVSLATLPALTTGANTIGAVNVNDSRTTTTATITTGGSLSAAVDLGAGAHLTGIVIPAAWDAAAITFQVAADGATYANLYDSDGAEVTLASATVAVGRDVRFTNYLLGIFAGVRYMKIRSGTSSVAVNQTTGGTDRVFTLVTRSLA